MEFCFIYQNRLIFALLPLISAILRVFFCMNTFLFICKLINPPASASWETEVADYVSFKGSIIQKIKIFFYLHKLDVKGVFWYNGCVKMIIGGQIYAI